MRPLRYLAFKTMKNRLREMVKKPARLIYAIVLLALLVFTMIGGSHTGGGGGAYHSMDGLTAIVLAFYTAMFIMTANAGFSRGGNIFNLSDATLLFTAPVRPQTILFYGLLRQMGTSLLVGFFLLFQYPNLHNFYNATILQMIALLILYGCAIFLGQVVAMMLYAFTSHDQRRQKLCRVVFTGIYALCGMWLAARCLPYGLEGIGARAAVQATGKFLYAVPVGGWLSLAAKGALVGDWGLAVQGVGLCVLLTVILLRLLFRMDPDYYEDVLKSAEISYSAISAKKEGTMREALPANVKIGRTGLRGGWGSSAFFRKHLLENRRSRKFILPANSLLFAVITVIFCMFTKDAGLLPTFCMASYLQLFSAMTTGRFNYELTRPYLYLVPEPALKKLLWALAETMPSMVLDALVIFVPVGVLLRLGPMEFVATVLARVAFGIVYLSADIAVQRIWGGSVSRVLVLLLYLAISLAVMATGVALALVGGLIWDFGAAGVLLLTVAGNLPASLLVLFLCRNLLEYAELSSR